MARRGKRRRSHLAAERKTEKELNTLHIEVDVVKLERKARRDEQIANGTFIRGGIHGGTDKQQNRRDRKKTRQELKRSRGERDGED